MTPMVPALVGLAAFLLLRGSLELLRSGWKDEGRPALAGQAEVPAVARDLGLQGLLIRSGKGDRVTLRGLLGLKAATLSGGLASGTLIAPVVSGRTGLVLTAAAAAGGFLLPDLVLRRAARIREQRMIGALPDTLDLLSVSVATGRGLLAGLTDLSRTGTGPLADELGRVANDIGWGSGQDAALERLRNRVPRREIAALCASLERSRRLGSPLADLLRRQSSELRQNQRRMIEEQAARAAPKIQLVIALVLVPSVLLLIVAALLANSDALVGLGY